jgi:hypothetical protein
MYRLRPKCGGATWDRPDPDTTRAPMPSRLPATCQQQTRKPPRRNQKRRWKEGRGGRATSRYGSCARRRRSSRTRPSARLCCPGCSKPRTVCFCQPVAATISVSVTPLARFITAITPLSCWLAIRLHAFAPGRAGKPWPGSSSPSPWWARRWPPVAQRRGIETCHSLPDSRDCVFPAGELLYDADSPARLAGPTHSTLASKIPISITPPCFIWTMTR